MHSCRTLLIVLFISAFIVPASYGQVFGKILSKTEADSNFGPVQISVPIETELLNKLLDRYSDVLMFNIIGGEPVILDKYREVVYSVTSISIPKEQIFYKYSISVIRELLISGGSATTEIEKRSEVLTVTNGLKTMEFGGLCPPFCEDE